MKAILIDVDGVLADFTASALALARSQAGIYDKTEADIIEWDCSKCIGWPGLYAAIDRAVLHDEFCYRMPEHTGAIAWLRALEREFGADRVFACTSPLNSAWVSQRAAWLEKRGVPLCRQIHTSAKHLISGLLVDDRPGLAASRPGTFCLARPWNSRSDEALRGDYAAATEWLRCE